MFRVRTVFTGVQGSPWLSTMYFSEFGGTASQAVTAVGTFWGAVDAHIANAVSWATEAEVATIATSTGEPTGLEITTPQTGTGSSGSQPIALAAQGLIRWRTGIFIEGRESRGRTFIPAVGAGDSVNGAPSTSLTTAVNAAAAALLADANSELEVYSRKHRVENPVLTGSLWGSFAVLRSRRD